jgi:hypothetical protein
LLRRKNKLREGAIIPVLSDEEGKGMVFFTTLVPCD